MHTNIGQQIKCLNHAVSRLFMDCTRSVGCDEITVINGRILGLIYFGRDRDIFQKDVEETFHITRSSVTSVVKLMEKKGYIKREPVDYDARLKKLSLTPLGVEAHERSMEAMAKTEMILGNGLDDGEKALFFALCEKIMHNIEDYYARGTQV